MRTATYLTIALVLATVAFGADQQPSNTREASCLIRITADPDIIPLNPQTINHLMLSSAVAGEAAQDVLALGPGHPQDIQESLYAGIEIEWLAQSVGSTEQTPASGRSGRSRGRTSRRSTGQSQDNNYDEMMEQLSHIYGERYVSAVSGDASPTQGNDKTPPSGMMMGGAGRAGGGMMGAGSVRGGTRGASGYGAGMMGGYGGGMGGGMMGGGMGGMGGGMGGMYGLPSQPPVTPGTQQTATLRLSVQLPDDIKPAAREFISALVENLRQTLDRSYRDHASQLDQLVFLAESQRQDAQTDLETMMDIHSPEHMLIEEQLATIVDLSMLNPEMPFAEAIDILRNAVEPPLQIVVLWKELLDSCEIEPATPIDMDGLPNVKLGTALKMLIAAVGGGFSDISYQIDDDVIVIREEEEQIPEAAPIPLSDDVDIRDLAGRRNDLRRDLERLEMDLAIGEARRSAIQEQIVRAREQAIQKLAEDVVTQELERLVEMSEQNLAAIEQKVTAGVMSTSAIENGRQSLARARIELARRREELGKSTGGNRVSQLNNELSQLAIDMAERTAQLQILHRQLAEAEDQLARASTFNPQAACIGIARETLNIAETRLTQLKKRLATLTPPMVAVIGAD